MIDRKYAREVLLAKLHKDIGDGNIEKRRDAVTYGLYKFFGGRKKVHINNDTADAIYTATTAYATMDEVISETEMSYKKEQFVSDFDDVKVSVVRTIRAVMRESLQRQCIKDYKIKLTSACLNPFDLNTLISMTLTIPRGLEIAFTVSWDATKIAQGTLECELFLFAFAIQFGFKRGADSVVPE